MASNEPTYSESCSLMERVLRGDIRRKILAGCALPRLRDSFKSQIFRAAGQQFDLNAIALKWDSQIPGVGFHVLHDWNGKTDKLQDEIISVEVTDYFIGMAPDAYSA